MNLNFEEILLAANGKVVHEGNRSFSEISTDTRKIKEGSLFIALHGENFNGNIFVNDAALKGASVCIVDDLCYNEKTIGNTSVIKVENTKQALLDIAEYYRKKLDIKVVGITGSNGKTSTKDLIAAVLSEKYNVFKTKGNFNNEIGVPLMIFQLDDSYDIAVIEMGMSAFGEIHRLSKTARPDIGVITNIGMSHIETLKTRDNILKAKMEITDFLKDGSDLVVNGTDDKLSEVKSDRLNIIKVGNDNMDFCAENIKFAENSTVFTTMIDKKKFDFKIPLLGTHNVYNTLLALCVGHLLNVSVDDMQKGMDNLEATSMRLDIIKKDNYTIINDCYNSSPSSVKAAFEVESNINSLRKVAILGTMKELGDESENAHFTVGEYAKEHNIDLLLLTGEYTNKIKEGYNLKNAYIYDSVEELIDDLKNKIKKGDAILVKASRSMKFERIVNALNKE